MGKLSPEREGQIDNEKPRRNSAEVFGQEWPSCSSTTALTVEKMVKEQPQFLGKKCVEPNTSRYF